MKRDRTIYSYNICTTNSTVENQINGFLRRRIHNRNNFPIIYLQGQVYLPKIAFPIALNACVDMRHACNSYTPLLGVHEMHVWSNALVPQARACNVILLADDPLSSSTYPMIIYTHHIAGN